MLRAVVRLTKDFGREVAAGAFKLQMVDMRQEQQQPGLEIVKEVFFDRRALDAIPQWQADDSSEPIRAKLLNRGGIGAEIRLLDREGKGVDRQLLVSKQRAQVLTHGHAYAVAVELERCQRRDDLGIVGDLADRLEPEPLVADRFTRSLGGSP